MIDHRNDMIITLFTTISILLSKIDIYFIDGIVGIGISIWIFYTGIKIFKESYDVLMDKAMSLETKKEVLEIIKNNKDIKGFRHFNATPVGYQYQISFTIFVDGNMSTYQSHQIADDLEKEIIRKIDEVYLVVIHVNPYEEK
jgi:cation diffusion facilitator family transporter